MTTEKNITFITLETLICNMTIESVNLLALRPEINRSETRCTLVNLKDPSL